MKTDRLIAGVLFCTAACLFAGSKLAKADDPLKADVRFESMSDNPIFVAAPGQWDSKIRERGWIIKDGDQWQLWYTGYMADQQPLMMKLGYATSKDGIKWTRYLDNPIISEFWVEDIMIVKHNDSYFMFAEGQGDQAQLLHSVDGIHWERKGTLDVRLTNGQPIPPGPFGTPTAFFEDGVWNLYYERQDAGIWLARSTDMKTWTNVSDVPIIVPGPTSDDSLMIAMNQVLKVDGKYIAVMHGTGTPQKPRQWCTYFAESDDLIHWTKSDRGSIRPIEENKSSGLLITDGDHWRLYTMHDKVDVHFSNATRVRP